MRLNARVLADAPHLRTPTRELVGQFAAPLRAYLRTETGSAGLLLAATIFALLWANSPFGDSYQEFWHLEISVGAGDDVYSASLQHWVNDGLMVFFFFVIGLELRRQLSMGELTDRRQVAIPTVAAIAGLVLPAVIYLALNPSGEAARGWGIAMATDTAFVLGALALVGPAFGAQLRVFMLSLSVVDDIGALLAIAVFYSEDINVLALGASAVCVLIIFTLGRLRVWRGPAYFVVGAALWVAMVASGVHPTLGGVVVGLLVSVYPPSQEEVRRAGALARAFGQSPLPELARSAKLSVERAVSPNERLQELLHPWTSFVIVPIFAIANAGVVIDGELIEAAIRSPVTHGVIGGLVLGKLFGIGLASTLGVRFGLGRLPEHVRKGDLWGGAALAGIGFTISLFVVELAFDDPQLQDEARLGVLAASVLAVLLGWAIFRLTRTEEGAPIVALDRPVDPAVDHIRGPLDAPLELVEYGDFQCPFCSTATGTVNALREQFGDRLRYVFRHLPLPDVHPQAELAAEAAEAAGAQGRFWEMHDLLFANQDRLDATDLIEYAARLGLDVERFARELGTGVYAKRVREDVASAQNSGADGTPTFFVNGTRQLGRYDAAALAKALGAGGAEERTGEQRVAIPLPSIGRLSAEEPRARGELELDGVSESPDGSGAFPRLTPRELAVLEEFGRRRSLEKGQPLFGDGRPSSDFVVVLSGLVAMVDDYGGANVVRTAHGEGRFLGELGVLSGQATMLTPVAARPSEVLVVPGDRLREAFAADATLRDTVTRAYLLRRSLLLGISSRVRIIGPGSSPDSQRLLAFVRRHGLEHVWTDTETDDSANVLLAHLGLTDADTPVVLTRGGDQLSNPSDEELAAALRL